MEMSVRRIAMLSLLLPLLLPLTRGLPLANQNRHPVYTTESIRDLYLEYSPKLEKTQARPTTVLIDMLVQV